MDRTGTAYMGCDAGKYKQNRRASLSRTADGSAGVCAAEPLPGTQPLTVEGDLAARMVAGIDRYLDRELAVAVARRSYRIHSAMAGE